jgi:hypothetical protein
MSLPRQSDIRFTAHFQKMLHIDIHRVHHELSWRMISKQNPWHTNHADLYIPATTSLELCMAWKQRNAIRTKLQDHIIETLNNFMVFPKR